MDKNVENIELIEVGATPVTEQKKGMYALVEDGKDNVKRYPLDNFKTADEVTKDVKEVRDEVNRIGTNTIQKSAMSNILGSSSSRIPTEYAVSEAISDSESKIKESLKIPYFETEEELKSAIPSPKVGDKAHVGNPAKIYGCKTVGVWYNTGITAPTEQVDLAKYVKAEQIKQEGYGDSEEPVSQIAVSKHLDNLGVYKEVPSLLSPTSYLDEDTPLIVDGSGKGIGAGDFEIRYPLDSNNSVNKTDGVFTVSLNSSGGANPAFWMLNKISSIYRVMNVLVSFTIRKVGGIESSLTLNLSSNSSSFVPITLIDDKEQLINTQIKFGNTYPDNRFMFFIIAETSSNKDIIFEISNLELRLNDGIVQQSQKNTDHLQTIGEYSTNILSPTSYLDEDTPLIVDGSGKGIGAGDFEIRYPLDSNNSVNKTDGVFTVSLNSSGGANPAFWMLNKIPSSKFGATYQVKFDIRKISGTINNISLLLNGSANQTLPIPINGSWQEVQRNIVFGNTYPDNRFMFFIIAENSSDLKFEIKNLRLIDTTLTLAKDYKEFKEKEEKQSSDVLQRLIAIEQTKGINLTLPNFLAKMGSIIYDGEGVVNIALDGDSWTHGVGTNGAGLICYTKYLTRILWKQFGYAGLGWFDFGRSNGTDMECADDEKTTFVPSGSLTYITRTEDAKGLTIAHTIMSAGATYSITISEDAPTDKGNILFAKGAKFSVSVNGGAAIEVNANNTDNWQNYLIEDNITSIVIIALSDNTIVYGIDFSYGNKGVKVHKLGCRGLTTRHPLAVDVDNWVDGLSKLNIDVFSVLLCTNDRTANYTPPESANNIKSIIDNAKKAHPLIDYVVICPSETKAGAGKYDIRDYGKEMYKIALDNDLAFVNLSHVFGTRDQILHLDTFEDAVHPTKRGGYIIAEYLYKMIFEYYQYKN